MSRPPGFVSSPRHHMPLPLRSPRAPPPPFGERGSRMSLPTPVRSSMSSREARESRQRAELPPRPRMPSPEPHGRSSSRSGYSRTSAMRSSLGHSPLLSTSGRFALDGHERRSTHSSASSYVAPRFEHAGRDERGYDYERQHRYYAASGRADAYEAYAANAAHEPRRNSDGSIAYATGPFDADRAMLHSRAPAPTEADRVEVVQRGRASASASLKHERLEYGASGSPESRQDVRSPSPAFGHQHKRRRTRPSSSERSPRRESPRSARGSSRRSGAERDEARLRESRSSTSGPRSPIKTDFSLSAQRPSANAQMERLQQSLNVPSAQPAQGSPPAHHARLLEAFEDIERRLGGPTNAKGPGSGSLVRSSLDGAREPETSYGKQGGATVQALAAPFEDARRVWPREERSSGERAPSGASSLSDGSRAPAYIADAASHRVDHAQALPMPLPPFNELLLRARESTSIDDRIQNARILLQAVGSDLTEEDREATRDVVWDLSESEYRQGRKAGIELLFSLSEAAAGLRAPNCDVLLQLLGLPDDELPHVRACLGRHLEAWPTTTCDVVASNLVEPHCRASVLQFIAQEKRFVGSIAAAGALLESCAAQWLHFAAEPDLAHRVAAQLAALKVIFDAAAISARLDVKEASQLVAAQHIVRKMTDDSVRLALLACQADLVVGPPVAEQTVRTGARSTTTAASKPDPSAASKMPSAAFFAAAVCLPIRLQGDQAPRRVDLLNALLPSASTVDQLAAAPLASLSAQVQITVLRLAGSEMAAHRMSTDHGPMPVWCYDPMRMSLLSTFVRLVPAFHPMKDDLAHDKAFLIVAESLLAAFVVAWPASMRLPLQWSVGTLGVDLRNRFMSLYGLAQAEVSRLKGLQTYDTAMGTAEYVLAIAKEYLKPINLRRSLAITPPVWGHALRRPVIIGAPSTSGQEQRATAPVVALSKAPTTEPSPLSHKGVAANSGVRSPVPPGHAPGIQTRTGVDARAQAKQEAHVKRDSPAAPHRAAEGRQQGLKVEQVSKSRSASPALGPSGVAGNRSTKSPEHASDRRSKGAKGRSSRRHAQ